ncbi:MAG: phosphoribosylformylglycinamidine synthase subunit PurQ [Patescibacteria group bacterium]
MTKPKALIFSGYGLNCEEETKYGFELAGATADIIHINDLIANKKLLNNYQILAFGGGFSYGDDTGAGNAFANKTRNHLWETLSNFIDKDHLAIGICNGFQIIANLGLLPAIKNQYGKRQAALVNNESARYTVRFVDLKVTNKTPWLTGIKTLSLPVAHGEGKFYTTKENLILLKKYKQIALTYFSGEACAYQNYPANPNGSLADIAGITDQTGKILGLMPHPERALFFTQMPNWPLRKEELLRKKKELPIQGSGLQLFKNAVQYFG